MGASLGTAVHARPAGCALLSRAPFSSPRWGPFGQNRTGPGREGRGSAATDGSAVGESVQVLNPDKSPDEDSVVITDDSEKQLESGEVRVGRAGRADTGQATGGITQGTLQDKSSDSEDERHSAGEEDSDEEDSDEEDRDGDVDQGFREQLMAVLQAGKALVSGRGCGRPCACGLRPATQRVCVPQGAVDGEDDDDDELGDEAMMALDQSLASLFAEQKLRIQARKDEKNKLRKEKVLQRDFQIRVSVRAASRASPRPPHPPRTH